MTAPVLSAQPAPAFTEAEHRAIFAPIHDRGDRMMSIFLLVHAGIALALGFYHETWIATFVTSAAAIGLFWASAAFFPRSFLTRCVAGVSLQTFCALHIYQLHGLAEMHFFFFTGFTMMIVYQDWAAMWPGALAIIGQHTIFAWLHNAGVPLHFFEADYVSVSKLFYHFSIAIAQVALCGFWAHLLHEQTLQAAARQRLLEQASRALDVQLGRVRESERELRVQSEQAREAERLQRAILDNLPDIAWVTDAHEQYLGANRAFAQALGIPQDRILGRAVREILPAALAEHAQDIDARVMRERTMLRDEERMVLPNGRVLDLETIRAPLIDEHQQVIGVIGVARDLTERHRIDTERRQLDEQIQQAQKLESLGVLAGGIAHDFNNLLLGIVGNVGIARLDVAADAPVQEALVEIEESAARATELTRQMLAYAGKGKMVIERITLADLVRSTSHLLESAVSKRATFTMDLGDAHILVEGDTAQLRQIVMNLVSNASESLGDRSGSVRLATRSVELPAPFTTAGSAQLLEPGRYAVLEVHDSGEGIPPEDQARIFEPFFTTKFAGRGLGLPAVLGILRGHGGAIDVRASPAGGTVFTVYLPACQSPTEAGAVTTPGAAPQPPLACHGATVLVVDDEDVVRAVATRMLETLGATVRTAPTGTAALQMLGDNGGGVDLVLLDLALPDMRGDQVLQSLRARRVPVLVLLSSGYGDEATAAQALADGAAGFVEKPYTLHTLGAAIRAARTAPV